MDVENPNSGDCHKDPGNLTLEQISECVRNAEESLATQSRVSGSRITARRVQPEQERGAYGEPLHKSCTKRIVHLIEGAYREHCPDLMEFLQEELTNSQERQKALVKVGNEAGYGSPLFQKWRKSLDLASDSLHQAQQEKKRYWAATFRRTLEKVRHPQAEEPEREYRKLFKRKYPDPPLVDSYHKSCVSLAMQMISDVTGTKGPVVLLELLLEDLIHVQKRQQALFRDEFGSDRWVPKTGKTKLVDAGQILCM